MISRFLDNLAQDKQAGLEVRYRTFLPEQPAQHVDVRPALRDEIRAGLRRHGIDKLYSHQAEAIEAIRAGENVVVVTPTASGKSLTYVLPVLESLFENEQQSAMLLFPLKALEQDQRAKLERWQSELKSSLPLTVDIYDGDTPQSRRVKIKRNPPHFVITNPDMLHQGILAYHQGWEKFLKRLKYIIIDELHAYRGIFGSQILQVFRRLSRLFAYYEVNPQFICLSATIANPLELAERLTQRTYRVIDQSGAPMVGRHIAFVNPVSSMSAAVAKLLIKALDSGFRTIVFSKARVATEVIHRIIIDQRPDLAKKVSSYRAGFLPEERREIERKLLSGELLGVISTSALELGIDIGGLDMCILAGYPGSVMSFWQRSGRVGRRGTESAIILVAGYDALDQYFLNNPDAFFTRGYETALVNESNDDILRAHLPSAAAEIPLMRTDPFISVERHAAIISELEREGALIRSASGNHWFAGRPRPHAQVNLRNVGGTFDIYSNVSKRGIGEISGSAVFRECHDGAIYLHAGEQYRVEKLDLERKRVHVEPVNSSMYTMVRSDKQTEIIDDRQQKRVRSLVVHVGKVKVTETYHSYERRRIYTQELLSVEPLDLPPYSYVTTSAWIDIPERIPLQLAKDDLHCMGGIHATEHAAISLIPLLALCDRADVGGISFTRHKQLPGAGIFFYDGYPGGIGIAEQVFERIEELLQRTLELIQRCSCEEGCPSCIQSPKCGSGNKPLDKRAAIAVLEGLLREPSAEAESEESVIVDAPDSVVEVWEPRAIPTSKRVLVVDLETQLSAEDVGGWSAARHMRLAVGVVWDSSDDQMHTYDESQVEQLLAHLKTADLVVGFNIAHFDYEVLRGYTFENLSRLPTLDLLTVVTDSLGKRLKLDTLTRGTLGEQKSADGLQSLAWFKEGKLDLVKAYCAKDVELTRDVLKFALEHGYLVYERKDHGPVRIPIRIDLDSYMTQAAVLA